MAVVPAFFGLLMVSIVTAHVTISPETAVRRVGDSLEVICKASYKISSCRMIIGGQSYIVVPDQQTDVSYLGEGLEKGECGAHIRGIKEEWNGNVSCMVPPETGNIEVMGTMRLTVARAPENPILVAPEQGSFLEGTTFMAQCVVGNGRPAAKISWFLGDEQLLEGLHNPVLTSERSDLQTISQNLTRSLRAEDNSKRLVCRAEHEALDSPRDVGRQLIVEYPPKRLEQGDKMIFGLKLGQEGRLDVTIRANPEPEASWMLRDMKIDAPGKRDREEGNIIALQPVHAGNGFYNITLVLAKVNKEDVGVAYLLTASNRHGSEDIVVRISTMDEPAGVELDTGAIVGIVVGVLVVLIAVTLVVFAKATDRWCFAGANRARDHTKSSGESSDTESAVGGRQMSRLAGLSARVRAALPRGRDKVQATDTRPDQEDKSAAEEKKSVVYAELALGEQTAAKPPPPSTEYAEIVYTDPTQPKETKE